MEAGVNTFLMATDTDGVALDFGTPHERYLRELRVGDAERYLKEGQFPAGSMGPKVEAAVEFIRHGGNRAVISSIDRIEDAVEGRAGTEFIS